MAGTRGAFVQPDPNSDPFPMSASTAPGPADNTAFAEGVSPATPIAVEFQDAGTDLTAGRSGVVRGTAKRAAHVNLRTSAGVEMGTTTTPQNVSSCPGQKASYAAASLWVAAANPTDVFVLTGSATKTVRVQRVTLTGTQTVSGYVEPQLARRSTANTGGTLVGSGLLALDGADGAPTATSNVYTANPATLGTSAGIIIGERRLLASAAAGGLRIEWTWNQPGQRQPTIRGVLESICLNFQAVAMAGGAFEIVVEFTEE